MRKLFIWLILMSIVAFCFGNVADTDTAREKSQNPRMIVPDANYERPPTLSDLLMYAVKNKLPKVPLPPPRKLSPGIEKYYGPLPVSLPSAVSRGEYGMDTKHFRSSPSYSPSEALDYGGFDASDILVSTPSALPQFQPTIATDDSGNVFAAWIEEIDGNNWAVKASRSTDGGYTWESSVTVDGSGWNLMPRLAAFTAGAYTRVHLTYQKVEMHIYDIYDTSGTYLGQDTTYEGDVYYSRSNNTGASYSSHYPLANSDIDLIILHFNYDESYPDIAVDDANNVAVAFNTQADEGHILNIALLIIYIILFEGLPPFWFEYTWYTIEFRSSTSGGGTWSSAEEIVNEWFVDRWYPAIDIYGTGAGATMFCSYAQAGFLSLMNATTVMKEVDNPFYSPSVGDEVFIADGYCVSGGLKAGSDGNPRVAITDDFSWDDYDVYYTYSTDGGSSFISPIIIDIGYHDSYEPRMYLDEADNPFMAWTDARDGDYDIWCAWSEDGGITLRDDQHKVNQDPWNDNQYWPGVSLFLSDTVRRLDIDWWDTRYDPDGDIYYNHATWWRTNLHIQTHDSMANPIAGTVGVSYWSFGVLIERELEEGEWIIYHDPYTDITVDAISSGSDSTERWVLYENYTVDTVLTPTTPGNTYTLTYYDQYNTIFTTTKGNPPACPHPVPTGIFFTFQYFDGVEFGNTDYTHWADVHGIYNYTTTVVVTADQERWHTPEPGGYVMSTTIAPTYYHQWNAEFMRPLKQNSDTGECACTHTVPSFTLLSRYCDGENVGGATAITAWTDCGSIYEYENPKIITSQQRWMITSGASDVVDSLGPYQPDVYHQWKPSIVLIGPSDTNTTCCESYWNGGIEYYETDLWGTYYPWVDCASRLKMYDFTTLGWVARDPTEFSCITSAFMASIRYGNVVSVTLRNDFGYGFIMADGDTLSSPAVIGWAPSSDHTITAVTPQEFGATRYVWDHWDDGGEVSHMVTVISDTEFVAFFNRQFRLEIISDHGDPWGDGWYDEGTSAEFGVEQYDSVGGIRYVFTGWTGTGTGSYTGTDTCDTVIMNNPITEEASWDVEYKLNVTYTGTSIIPTQTGTGWYAAGSMASISTDSILGDDGTDEDSVRFLFDHWESTPSGAIIGCPNCANTQVFMDQPYTVTAVYVTQYRFWVFNDTFPDTLGAPDPAVGAHWITSGDSVVALVTSPYDGMYCTGYAGTGSVPTTGYSDTARFVMEEPSSITWHWGNQYILDVHAVLDGTPEYSDWLIDHPSMGASPPSGTTYVIPGDTVTVQLDNTLYEFLGPGWQDTCYAWSSIGAPCGAIDSCWGTGDSISFVMNENTLWLWHFTQQCSFEVKCTTATGTCGYDTPVPEYGYHWFDYGSEIMAYVSDPIDGEWYCVGYYSTWGSGWGDTTMVTINGPSWLAWRWVHMSDIESLTVITEHAPWECNPPAGVIYLPSGITIDVQAPLYDEPDTLDGTRFVCTGWEGTGCVPESGSTNYVPGGVTITESGTITWQWRTEHRVTIESEYDSPYPDTGDHWYPEGAVAVCSLESIIDTTDTGTAVYCVGWHPDFPQDTCLDFGVLDTLSNEPITFSVDCPVTITWKWSDYLAPLIVYSDHDSPIPSDTSWWIPGTEVTAFVTSPADWDTAYGERWVCTGWTGTGDVPPSGSEAAVTFTIEDTSTITWHWKQQYRLHITTNTYPNVYGMPDPDVGDYWFDVGDSVYCSTRPTDMEGTDTMYCVGLHGTGCVPDEWPMVEIWLNISEPGTLEWQWYNEDTVTHLCVRSPYDSPFPYGVSYWLLGDTIDATVEDSVVSGGEVISCIGWHGVGDSLPSIGDSTHINFTIWTPCTLWWDWSTVYHFTVDNPSGYDTPHPPVGDYIYPAGSYITGYIEEPIFIDALGDTHWCIGYFGTGDLDSVSPQVDFAFTITQNSSIEWRWADTVVQLDVYSDYGEPHPYGTTYWIPGTDVNAYVDSDVDIGDGVRAHCTGFVGTGSVPGSGSTNSINFTINENSSLTWLWEVQYQFTVNCSTIYGDSCGYDAPNPSYGEHWYAESTIVSGMITTNPVYVGAPEDSMYCIGYAGTGDLADTSHQTDFEFTITQPTSITWIWAPADTVVQLIVYSDYDDPMPYGTTYWLIGQTVDATVDSMAYSPDSTERHNCLGFEVIGAIDSLDTTGVTELMFVIDRNTELWWLWDNQYYITLTYEGLPGGYEPEQIGEGWYAAGETAWVETETPVDCESYGIYGFYLWTYEPHDPDVVGDTLINATTVIVNDNYTLTAHYSLAHQVVVSKHPDRNNTGWILIDTEYHDSTAMVVDWWGDGSYHDIGVPSVDSTAYGRRYLFDYWSDGGDTLHRVGPIDTDTTFTAYYTEQIMAIVTKNPVHTTGWLEVDSVLYWDSTYIYGAYDETLAVECDTFGDPASPDSVVCDSYMVVVCADSATTGCSRTLKFWWEPGLIHTFEASPQDSFPASTDSARYFFEHWVYNYRRGSDSTVVRDTTDEIYITTETMIGPGSFVAHYLSKWRITLTKEPPETLGYFLFYTPSDTDTIYNEWRYNFWSLGDENVVIGVSEFDILDVPGTGDSVYTFQRWSDDGELVHEIGPITSAVEETAFYDADVAVLAIYFDPQRPDSFRFNWYLDTLDPCETKAMDVADSIKIVNDGNVPIDIGIRVYETFPSGWFAGFYQDEDNFMLLCEFTNNNTPPVTFSPIRDYVKMTTEWANENRFGPGGYNILPPPYPSEEQFDYMWLKFLAPTSSSIVGEVRIQTMVIAKYRMP
ncbi:hypothetical protein DRQ33_01810 [bacterium]|nr:MAG: hypothetical protein DRQ33_01810 [bacterium]